MNVISEQETCDSSKSIETDGNAMYSVVQEEVNNLLVRVANENIYLSLRI